MKTHKLAHCLFLLALMLLFWGVSCKEVTGPGEEQPQTPDTTSHDWQWTLTTLGDGGSSSLYDVTIIHDSLAYAVGEIYLRDTATGQLDPIPYNLAKWNGKEWKIERLYFNINGTLNTGILTAIIAFSEEDIWVADNAMFKKMGNTWVFHEIGNVFPNVRVNKIWGTSSNNLYIVGNNGNLAHYDGSVWRRINSGTSLDLRDIYGTKIDNSNQYQILFIGNNFDTRETGLFMVDTNRNIKSINIQPITNELDGVWFESGKKYVVCGGGIYMKNSLNEIQWLQVPRSITNKWSTNVRGNHSNDLIVCGAFFNLMHWNGKSWMTFWDEKFQQLGSFGSISIKNNLVIVVGGTAREGYLAIGRRN